MKNRANVIFVAALWLGLTLLCWVLPPKEISIPERRPLAQMPEIQTESLLSGSFMEDFEDYSLDQFPLRDSFRKLKAWVHFYLWNQSDNNGIYIAQDMAVQQEYPLDMDSLSHAAERFQSLYDRYLRDSNIYFAIVPDKGQYLAEASGHLRLDVQEMAKYFQNQLPWAVHVDITDCLDGDDYYHTDTHWRQERLLGAAQALCHSMGVTPPFLEDYRVTPLEKPFYGVYYGQAALPMEPETMYLLESDILDGCTVYDHETGKTTGIYDLSKLESRDLYDVYLSGAKSLLTIENPNADSDRELIVFRDSFGSAMVPLLLQDYSRVIVVDIRYIQPSMLPKYVDFHGQDVLFLYSTLVLNNSETIK